MFQPKIINRLSIPPIPFLESEFLEVVRQNQLVVGPHLEQLTETLKQLYKKKYCVLTSNASSALFLSILAQRMKGIKILLPAAGTCFSFVNAAIASGNEPVFCDIDPTTSNLDVQSVRKVCNRKKIELIISPNHFGIPSPCALFRSMGIPVIEDAAQSALTNMYINSQSDVLILSFYPTKVLNGADGGALLTNNALIFKNARDAVYYDFQKKYDGKVRFNFRMPNIHSYLVLNSLTKVEHLKAELSNLFLEYKHNIDAIEELNCLGYNEDHIPLRLIVKAESKSQRDKLLRYCLSQNIFCAKELLMISEKKAPFPKASCLVDTTFSLPFHEQIKVEDIKFIFNTIKDALSNKNSYQSKC